MLAGRYTGSGASAVVLEGTVDGAKRQFTYEVKFPKHSDEHEFIPRLWATRRVGYLLDEIRLHGENAELRDEVTELARQYGIVTPYTAYLIAEDEDRRHVPLSMQSLPQINTDRSVRNEAAQNWKFFRETRGGEQAVAGARYGNVLKSADNLAAPGVSGAMEANRALGVTAVPASCRAVSRCQSPVGSVFATGPVGRREKFLPEREQSMGGHGSAEVPEREEAAHPVQFTGIF